MDLKWSVLPWESETIDLFTTYIKKSFKDVLAMEVLMQLERPHCINRGGSRPKITRKAAFHKQKPRSTFLMQLNFNI